MGTKLLDLPPERSERTKMIEKSELHRNAVWALGLVTARLACRFVLLEDFLEGNAMQCSDPELILRYRNHPTDTADAILDISIPPPEMLEGILAVDLKVPLYPTPRHPTPALTLLPCCTQSYPNTNSTAIWRYSPTLTLINKINQHILNLTNISQPISLTLSQSQR